MGRHSVGASAVTSLTGGRLVRSAVFVLQGFGDVFGEHWLGNEALHLLTSQSQYSLRVELQDWEGNHAHSQYDRFTLTDERQQYRYKHAHTSTRALCVCTSVTLSLSPVTQVVSERLQRHSGEAEQPGHPRDRLQHPRPGQRQL